MSTVRFVLWSALVVAPCEALASYFERRRNRRRAVARTTAELRQAYEDAIRQRDSRFAIGGGE